MATVVVRAKSDKGRWRAGRHWPHAPATYDVDAETLAALRGDPQLVVREVRPDDAPPVVCTTIPEFEAEVARLTRALAEARAAGGAPEAPPELEAALREAVARIEALEGENAELKQLLAAATDPAAAG